MIAFKTLCFGTALVLTTLLAGCPEESSESDSHAQTSGVVRAWFDTHARPQDDLYRAANGHWLDREAARADDGAAHGGDNADERSTQRLRAIFEDPSRKLKTSTPSLQRARDFYASYLDRAAIERRGSRSLEPVFARIDAMRDARDIAAVFSYLDSLDIPVPVANQFFTHPDDAGHPRWASRIIDRGSLFLPDESSANAQSVDALRTRTTDYIRKMLNLSGDAGAAAHAADVVDFEAALSRIQSAPRSSEDRPESDRRFTPTELRALAPRFDWDAYFEENGTSGKTASVFVEHPDYIRALDMLLGQVSLDALKAHLKFKTIEQYADALPEAVRNTRIQFKLRGGDTSPDMSRLHAAIETTGRYFPLAVGREYAARHFTAERKAHARATAEQLRKAYRDRVSKADWLDAEARKQALTLVDTVVFSLGYPDAWGDDPAHAVVRDDALGNLLRANHSHHDAWAVKLGTRADLTERDSVTPHAVEAVYIPDTHTIAISAAFIEHWVSSLDNDDATRYGGLGVVLGHELSHAFDPGASWFTDHRNWSEATLAHYRARNDRLTHYYEKLEALPGIQVDGALTLAENFADVAGVQAAYDAYVMSAGAAQARVIDGLTGPQRFFYAYAQMHRSQTNTYDAIESAESDSHAPKRVRVNAVARTMSSFHDAFSVVPRDAMYLPPNERIVIW
ncbi:M13-type metalloendopeptidase [Pararobbsia silviterrae]|uniref:M13 family peptidase n=1 Tax=Pararobbsia silviterrae TaxID=1792498 RepID=A0A494XKK1_9BURK|nr:M13 family metallopeptidase [Pararobbsia silviterrae]RKP48679.1 M13 family peptidase [Pararobbsia silviterrae]